MRAADQSLAAVLVIGRNPFRPLDDDYRRFLDLLSIQIGNWAGGSFAAGAAAAVPVTVAATDTLSDIATKINNADAGVSATVLRDASGERLLVRSSTTGEVNGFQITATDDDGNNTDAAGLSRLAYGGTSGAMHGMSLSQAGANAQATVNSVPISSATNTISDALPGITLNLNKVTTGPVEVGVLQDKDGIRKNLQAFVDAYNAINNMLVTATKYDPDTKTAGSLQGDSTAVGLQNALRRMMGSVTPGGDFQRLSDIGITIKTGGVMSIDNTKLDKAMENPAALQRLFANESSIATEKGFGFKVKAFADGITSDNGLVTTRTEVLRTAITRNGKEQDKINERATRAEARFLAQYNAMDAAVGQLSGGIVLALEDTGSRMSRLGRAELVSGEYQDIDETLRQIQAVTAAEVQELARELAAAPRTVTVVGPFEETETFGL